MRFRYTVTDPERTRKLTAPFAALFHPLIVAAVTVAFLASCWWVLMVKGLGSATHDAFANPGLLLLIFAITVLSAGFHEFGHAAAARRGGATPGAMGAGLYLVWPAFYTDVTDSYRLGRGGRLRTDLGGLYFNAIVAVAIMGIWWASGYDALLLVVLTQILQMVRQLLPLLRFDGYHILADATGVPDLFQRIKPTLRGLLPWNWRKPEPEAQALKPWARAVITAWVLITVPLLLASLVLMVLALPRLLGTAWASLEDQQGLLAGSLAGGNFADAAVRVLAIAAVVLPLLGIGYMLVRLARQLAWASGRRPAAGHCSAAQPWPPPLPSWPGSPGRGGLHPARTGRCSPTNAERCSMPRPRSTLPCQEARTGQSCRKVAGAGRWRCGPKARNCLPATSPSSAWCSCPGRMQQRRRMPVNGRSPDPALPCRRRGFSRSTSLRHLRRTATRPWR